MGTVKKSLKLHNFLWQNIKLAKYASSYINRLCFQLGGRVRGGVSKWTALRPALPRLFSCFCLRLWGFLPAKASCFLTSWILCHGPSCLGAGAGPPPPRPAGLSWLRACMWFIGLTGRAARQSCTSHLLIFPSLLQQQWPASPCLSASALLPPGPSAGAGNPAFCPAPDVFTFIAAYPPGLSIAQHLEVRCRAPSRLGFHEVTLYRLGLLQHRYRSLGLAAAISNSSRKREGGRYSAQKAGNCPQMLQTPWSREVPVWIGALCFQECCCGAAPM